MLHHNTRGKELAKHVVIHIESNRHRNLYPWQLAKKYLGTNGIKIARKYNVDLEDIHIGSFSSILPILVLMLSLLVFGTEIEFHACICSNVEIPIYFHPSPMENGILPVPWGYFSHDPTPTSNGKEGLMKPYPDAPENLFDVYKSTLTGMDAAV